MPSTSDPLQVLGPGTDYTATDRPAPERSPAVIFASGEEQVAPPSRTLLFKEERDSQESWHSICTRFRFRKRDVKPPAWRLLDVRHLPIQAR